MGKDKKKKHAKKHKKKDVVSVPEQTMFTYTLHFGSISTTYDSGWIWSLPVQVPQMFQEAFKDGELDV